MAVADYARRLHARGWVANHDGNLSVRLDDGTLLITPTATSKAEITADGLLVVDDQGAIISGSGRPFSELSLHRVVYAERPDVRAVVHAHPPTATGFAVAGVPLDEPFIAEAVVSLGRTIPTVQFAPPGDAAMAALRPFCREHDVVLLANHGVLAWGVDVEQAYLRLELVEHLARVALVARQLGGVVPLPESSIAALLAARQKAGLGPDARPGAESVSLRRLGSNDKVVACAPAPPGATVEVYERDGDLARIIRQEIARALSSDDR